MQNMILFCEREKMFHEETLTEEASVPFFKYQSIMYNSGYTNCNRKKVYFIVTQ